MPSNSTLQANQINTETNDHLQQATIIPDGRKSKNDNICGISRALFLRLAVFAILILGFAGVIVGIVTKDGGNEKMEPTPVPTPAQTISLAPTPLPTTLAPTLLPTPAPTTFRSTIIEDLLLKYFDTPLHSDALTWLAEIDTWLPSEGSKTTVVTGPNG